ncbi:hypothetical protein Tco_0580379 [Tanacetum coccineum]
MARCGSGHLYCRVADRGNIGGALDLFDREVEQPQRLMWLTPGLGAVDRVKRLQHLVPGLGLVSSSALEETKRDEPVWDESTGDEEYLTNDDSIYDSQPVYDEYADEEWYSLFIRGDRNLSGEMLVEGGDRLGGDGIGVATVGDFPNLKVPIFQPPNTESLNFELYKVGCKLSMHEAITCGPVMLIEQLNENMAMHMRVVKNLNCDVPQANNLRKSNSNGSIMNKVGKVKLFMEVMMIIMKGNHVDVPFDPGGSFLGIIKTRGRILSVVSLKKFERYGYAFMKEIVIRGANYKEYKISEADFKNLHPNDFEDLYLLHLQGKLNHLPGSEKVHLYNAVNMWIRNIVIRQHVGDLQLGIESY